MRTLPLLFAALLALRATSARLITRLEKVTRPLRRRAAGERRFWGSRLRLSHWPAKSSWLGAISSERACHAQCHSARLARRRRRHRSCLCNTSMSPSLFRLMQAGSVPTHAAEEGNDGSFLLVDGDRVVGWVQRWHQQSGGEDWRAGLGRRGGGAGRAGRPFDPFSSLLWDDKEAALFGGWPGWMEDMWRSQAESFEALEDQLALALPWHAERQSMEARQTVLARALAGLPLTAADLQQLGPGVASAGRAQAGAGAAEGGGKQGGPAERMAMWGPDPGGSWQDRRGEGE